MMRSVLRVSVAGAMACVVAILAGCAQPQPAPRNPVKHQQFLDRAKQGKIDLLFFGDSITAGWNGEVWTKNYGRLHAANFGISGETTQQILWGVLNGEADGISPKVVVLLIGTNNTPRNSAEEIAEGIRLIVKALRQKLPKSKVLVLGIFPRGEKPNPLREKIQKINRIIAKLDDGKNVRFLDFGSKFLQSDGTIPKSLMPDFLHLSKEGYELWAESMQPLLTKMGLSPPPPPPPASKPAR